MLKLITIILNNLQLDQGGWIKQSRIWFCEETCTIKNEIDLTKTPDNQSIADIDISVVNIYNFSETMAGTCNFAFAHIDKTGKIKNGAIILNVSIDLSAYYCDDLSISVFDSVYGNVSNVSVTGFINLSNFDGSHLSKPVIKLSKMFGAVAQTGSDRQLGAGNAFYNVSNSVVYKVNDVVVQNDSQLIEDIHGNNFTVRVANELQSMGCAIEEQEEVFILLPSTQSIQQLLSSNKLFSKQLSVEFTNGSSISYATYSAFNATLYANAYNDFYSAGYNSIIQMSEAVSGLSSYAVDSNQQVIEVFEQGNLDVQQVIFFSQTKVIAFIASGQSTIQILICIGSQKYDATMQQCSVTCDTQQTMEFGPVCLSTCPAGFYTGMSDLDQQYCYLSCPSYIGFALVLNTNISQCRNDSSLPCGSKLAFGSGCVDVCPLGSYQNGTICTLFTANNCPQDLSYFVPFAEFSSQLYFNACTPFMPEGMIEKSETEFLLKCDGYVQNNICHETEEQHINIYCPSGVKQEFSDGEGYEEVQCIQQCVGLYNVFGVCVSQCPANAYKSDYFTCNFCQSSYDGGMYYSTQTQQCTNSCTYIQIVTIQTTTYLLCQENCSLSIRKDNQSYYCISGNTCNTSQTINDPFNQPIQNMKISQYFPYMFSDTTQSICVSTCRNEINQFLENFTCVQNCSKSLFLNKTEMECIQNCSFPNGKVATAYPNQMECVEQCPMQYLLRTGQQCTNSQNCVFRNTTKQNNNTICEDVFNSTTCPYISQVGTNQTVYYQCLMHCSYVVFTNVAYNASQCILQCPAQVQYIQLDGFHCNFSCNSNLISWNLAFNSMECVEQCQFPLTKIKESSYNNYYQCEHTCTQINQSYTGQFISRMTQQCVSACTYQNLSNEEQHYCEDNGTAPSSFCYFYVQSGQSYICVNICPNTTFISGIKCITACPGPNFIQSNANGTRSCQSDCNNTYYSMVVQNHTYTLVCSKTCGNVVTGYDSFSSNDKRCDANCNNFTSNIYQNGTDCKNACSPLYINYSNGVCISQCQSNIRSPDNKTCYNSTNCPTSVDSNYIKDKNTGQLISYCNNCGQNFTTLVQSDGSISCIETSYCLGSQGYYMFDKICAQFSCYQFSQYCKSNLCKYNNYIYTNQSNLCVNSCPPPNKIQINGSIYNCITSCTNKQYVEEEIQETIVEVCKNCQNITNGVYLIDYQDQQMCTNCLLNFTHSNKVCNSQNCSFDTSKFNNNGTCVSNCTSQNKLIQSFDNWTCVSSCQYYINQSNSYYCTQSCTDPYSFSVGQSMSFNNVEQCVQQCPSFSQFIENQSCQQKCSTGYYYIETDEQIQYHICILSCPHYYYMYNNSAMECMDSCNSTYIYQDGSSCKQYCQFFTETEEGIRICQTGCSFYYIIINNSTMCVDQCTQQYQYLLGLQCYDYCPPGYYENQSNQCDQTCQSQFYMNDNNLGYKCTFVQFCTYYIENQSLLECRDACQQYYEQLVINNYSIFHCISSCVASNNGNKLISAQNSQLCIQSCNIGEYLNTTQQQCQTTCSRYNVSTGQCSLNCTFTFNTSNNNKICQACQAFTLNTSMNQKNGSCNDNDQDVDGLCLSSCNDSTLNSSNIYFIDTTGKYCVTNCPINQTIKSQTGVLYLIYYGTFQNGTNYCMLSCPYQYTVSDQQNCNYTNNSYAYVYQLQHCIANCSLLLSYGYVSIDNKTCVSSCFISNFTLFNNQSCSPSCIVYTSQTIQTNTSQQTYNNCSTYCNQSYFMVSQQISNSNYSNMCIATCNSTSFIDIDGLSCVSKCSSQIFIIINGTAKCLQDLSSCLYYISNITNNVTQYQCINSCPSNQSYIQLKQCLVNCTTGFKLVNGSCIPNCSSQTPYYNSTIGCVSYCSSSIYQKYSLICISIINNSTCNFYQKKNGLIECLVSCSLPLVVFVTQLGKECLSQCPNNTFMEINGTCTSKCASKIFDLQRKCIKDTDLCVVFRQENCGYNVTLGALQCDSICIDKCLDTEKIYGNQCLSQCPITTFIQGQMCVLYCSTLIYSYNNNSCLSNSSTCKFFYIINKAIACTDSCAQYGEIQIFSNTTCVSQCSSTNQLNLTSLICQTRCTNNTYWNGSSCVSICTGFYDNATMTCVQRCINYSVKSGSNTYCVPICIYPLISNTQSKCINYTDCIYYIENGSCVSKCNSKIYDSSTKICLQNQYNCSFFVSNNSYLICVSQCPTLSQGQLCVSSCNAQYQYHGQCLSQCPTTSHVISSGFTCLDDNETAECSYYYLEYGLQICAQTCSAQNIVQTSICLNNCTLPFNLSNTSTCLQKCSGSMLYIENGSCVSSCSTKVYDNATLLCLPNISVCSFYIINGSYNVCVSTCQYYMQTTIYDTYQCVTNCGSYYLQGSMCVSKCNPNVYTDDKKCLNSFSACPDYYTIQVGTISCSSSCPNYVYGKECVDYCTNFIGQDGITCFDQCPNKIYIEEQITGDYICQDSCSTFLVQNGSNSQCVVSCPQYILNQYCVQSCPISYVLLDKNCLQTCPENLFNDSSQCVSTCGSKIFNFQNSERVCLSNDLNCSYVYLEYQEQINVNYECCVPLCPVSNPYQVYITGMYGGSLVQCLAACGQQTYSNLQFFCQQCSGYIFNYSLCVQNCAILIAGTNVTGIFCNSSCPPDKQYIVSNVNQLPTCVSQCLVQQNGMSQYVAYNYPSMQCVTNYIQQCTKFKNVTQLQNLTVYNCTQSCDFYNLTTKMCIPLSTAHCYFLNNTLYSGLQCNSTCNQYFYLDKTNVNYCFVLCPNYLSTIPGTGCNDSTCGQCVDNSSSSYYIYAPQPQIQFLTSITTTQFVRYLPSQQFLNVTCKAQSCIYQQENIWAAAGNNSLYNLGYGLLNIKMNSSNLIGYTPYPSNNYSLIGITNLGNSIFVATSSQSNTIYFPNNNSFQNQILQNIDILAVGGTDSVFYVITQNNIYFVGNCNSGMCGTSGINVNSNTTSQFSTMTVPFTQIAKATIGYSYIKIFDGWSVWILPNFTIVNSSNFTLTCGNASIGQWINMSEQMTGRVLGNVIDFVQSNFTSLILTTRYLYYCGMNLSTINQYSSNPTVLAKQVVGNDSSVILDIAASPDSIYYLSKFFIYGFNVQWINGQLSINFLRTQLSSVNKIQTTNNGAIAFCFSLGNLTCQYENLPIEGDQLVQYDIEEQPKIIIAATYVEEQKLDISMNPYFVYGITSHNQFGQRPNKTFANFLPNYLPKLSGGQTFTYATCSTVACIFRDKNMDLKFFAAGMNSGNNSLKGCGDCNTIQLLSPPNASQLLFVAVNDAGDTIYGYSGNSFLIHFTSHGEVNEQIPTNETVMWVGGSQSMFYVVTPYVIRVIGDCSSTTCGNQSGVTNQGDQHSFRTVDLPKTLRGIRRAFISLSITVQDENSHFWTIQDIRYVQNQIYCGANFQGWLNMSKIFSGENISRISFGRANGVILTNASLYTCGNYYGTSRIVNIYMYQFDSAQIIDFSTFDYNTYLIYTNVTTKQRVFAVWNNRTKSKYVLSNSYTNKIAASQNSAVAYLISPTCALYDTKQFTHFYFEEEVIVVAAEEQAQVMGSALLSKDQMLEGFVPCAFLLVMIICSCILDRRFKHRDVVDEFKKGKLNIKKRLRRGSASQGQKQKKIGRKIQQAQEQI